MSAQRFLAEPHAQRAGLDPREFAGHSLRAGSSPARPSEARRPIGSWT
jgi:hypothetical protein